MTELNLTPGRRETDWIINVASSDASGGIDLKSAIPDYRYGIKTLDITPNEGNKWFKIMDGENVLVGPVGMPQNVTYHLDLKSPVYGTAGNALILKTESAYWIHLIVQGTTGPPIPSKPTNPSPANEETGVLTSATLTWESVYESVNYKVYFGTSESGMTMVSDQSELEYDPSLSVNTTYYWRIDEYLDGNTATGDVWTFTTGGT